MVVDVEPVGKSAVPLTLRGPGPDVSPFSLEGSVESLHFAIRLRAIGLSERMANGSQGGIEPLGAVAAAVVRENALDRYPEVSEVLSGSAPEGDGRVLGLSASSSEYASREYPSTAEWTKA